MCEITHSVSVEHGNERQQEGHTSSSSTVLVFTHFSHTVHPQVICEALRGITGSIQLKVLDYIDLPLPVFSASLCPYGAHLLTNSVIETQWKKSFLTA